ncbi:hypothetical protein DFH27DRAFT_483192 [Peziza echinospora]|nr:hypothetical protein DFH27DRAFT_483192 [Peziza echinospora]
MASSTTPTTTTAPVETFPQLLVGKTAIITGGATGIGRAIALEYIRHGCNVCINYYDPHTPVSQSHLIDSLLLEIAALPLPPNNTPRPKFLAIEGDISDPATATTLVARTVQEFAAPLDIFVSNAGVCKFHDFLTLPPDLLNHTVATNLNGAFYAVQAAARQMVSQGHGGSIIGISSISALVGGAEQTHYTPTKAGVLSLMQSCATALGRYGIRCNALLPGTVRTRLNEVDLEDEGKRAYMEGRIPLGRLGVPRDLAGPAVFLASGLSEYVTGAQLLVDGGLFVNLQ